MTDEVINFQEKIRKSIHIAIGEQLANHTLDAFEESYKEESQKWVIKVSFNHGDERIMKVILDINPDE